MRAAKYLIALWVGVLIYALFSANSGPKGFRAYSQLEAELDKEKANVEELMVINHDLGNTKDALLYDRDTLAVYAREQGFARSDEKFIRIVGLGNTPKMTASPGRIVTAIPPEHTPDRFLRIFSFFAVLTLLICFGAYDFLNYLKSR
ncbi:septum formation initiator family protein [Leadbettera azotonutricia]|uniref:Putative septum formation initiator subfamily n=1 Tax=Leadbettera azotonutricia (strain ATCC BAA-888 / DSM 13862 / ZAS-9) TaxID=545695 RepID=F5YCW2_LEAAZ|nr:septum formation initiator family protein [Leadbettera azotonutricia]AEF80540.1 putative septum formation initiator subfamily [Leadbettera azotonutricia ZAS-9]